MEKRNKKKENEYEENEEEEIEEQKNDLKMKVIFNDNVLNKLKRKEIRILNK